MPLGASARLQTTSFIPSRMTVGQLTEAELDQALQSEIEKIADRVFAEAKLKHPDINHLMQVRQAVLTRAEKAKKHFVKVLRIVHPTVGVAIVAVEIFVTAGLVPWSFANGHYVLGTFFTFFPTLPAMLGAVLAYEAQKIRWQISRELGVRLGEFDKIRKSIVGYNLKNKITSIVYDDNGRVRELELVKRLVSVGEGYPSVVSVREITELLKETERGREFLEDIAHERSHKEVYSQLLVRFLNENPETLNRLLTSIERPLAERQSRFERVRTRLSEMIFGQRQIHANDFPELRDHLVKISDIQKHIQLESQRARAEVASAKQRLKNGEISREAFEALKEQMKSERQRLYEMKVQSFRHQYRLLVSAKNAVESGNRSEVISVVDRFANEISELREKSSFERFQINRQLELPLEFRGESSRSSANSCRLVFSGS